MQCLGFGSRAAGFPVSSQPIREQDRDGFAEDCLLRHPKRPAPTAKTALGRFRAPDAQGPATENWGLQGMPGGGFSDMASGRSLRHL